MHRPRRLNGFANGSKVVAVDGCRGEFGPVACGVRGVDADYLLVAGWVHAVKVCAAVGGGGEEEDVLVVGIFDGFFEGEVFGDVAIWEAEGHGDYVDIPGGNGVVDCLHGVS